MSAPTQTYRQMASRRQRWLLMLLVIPVPYVLYTTVLDTSQTSPSGWLLPFVFVLITLLILGLLVDRGVGVRFVYVTALVCTSVAEVPWLTDSAHPADLWAYPLLILSIVYRLHRLVSAVSLIEENRSSFVFELIGIAISTLFMLMVRMNGGIREWLVFVMIVGLAMRIYAMWKAERAETNSQGAKGNFAIILAGTIAALWFGPRLRYWLLLALAGGGAVISLPFLYLLNALLPKHLLAKGLQQQNRKSQLLNSLAHQQHPTASGHSFAWILKVFYVIAFVAAVVLVWRLSRKQLDQVDDKTTDGTVTIRRGRLHSTPHRSFVETDNPVRREYQQWLDMEDKAGHPIELSETPAEFEERLEKLAREGHSTRWKGGLTRAYERVRYGRSSDRNSES
ncbi:DUF4129 domain-containing protein [Alicyclobacillus ferrooxydans]|uniref:Protein-glutamine gamma-glutamyltransferase-like C-terminal domain-containing protein n=1 Tax=Alicyclobacillus ferrooxydans TaxID=471514 RepID=A0A0N8PP94_9BACL|nr:DUF4129 domain-containing protein [Alicyclobacillus ferrooxydans]KPV43693.1 hypothetical protein AN477_11025 [Alicyclobacillus ferrooxydans]